MVGRCSRDAQILIPHGFTQRSQRREIDGFMDSWAFGVRFDVQCYSIPRRQLHTHLYYIVLSHGFTRRFFEN
jgi:hypothetical protein